jgi:hypothetical protein
MSEWEALNAKLRYYEHNQNNTDKQKASRYYIV